jgi:DNA-binding beta-propeller fold protein YncE
LYFGPLQVAGNGLFAFEWNTLSIVAFNFDRANSDYRQLGSYSPNPSTYSFAVSTDGKYVYMPEDSQDSVFVLDAVKLASGQAPLLTRLATGVFPNVVAVSPAH